MSTVADIIFYGGDIITMDESSGGGTGPSPKTEAVAISKDTILAVGTIDAVFRHAGPQTQVIFLNQQTLMPGFIEPHQHAILAAKIRSQFITIGSDVYRLLTHAKECSVSHNYTITLWTCMAC